MRHEPRREVFYAKCCRVWPCVRYARLPFLRRCGYCGQVPVEMEIEEDDDDD